MLSPLFFRAKTCILLLILTGLLVYFPVLFNGFVGDDFLQIVRNERVQSFDVIKIFSGSTYEAGGTDSVTGLYYRPLMLSIFSLLYTFFGLNPMMFHLVQLIFHIANSILVFIFLRRFVKDLPAFVLSLIFLVHPFNTESVVYSANLQEVLFFFFGMLTLLLLQRKTFPLKNYLFCGVLLLFSLFSKESGILFIVISSVYALFFQRKRFLGVIIAGIISFITYLIFRFSIAQMSGAQTSIAPIAEAGLPERIVHIPSLLFFYLSSFFFPVSLSSSHFWFITKATWETFYFPFLVSLCILGGIITQGYALKKKKSKYFLSYLFFSVWLVVGLLLHMQILPLDATVADRWFYFPGMGLLVILAIIVLSIRSPLLKKSPIPIGAFLLLIMVLSGLTIKRTMEWRDGLTLYSHDIRTTPRNFILDNAYASELIIEGEYQRAKPYLQSSIQEFPYSANLNNMAIVYASENDMKQAKVHLRQAARVTKNYQIIENYSSFLLVYDSLTEANVFTTNAIQTYPHNSKLWMNKAKIHYLLGEADEATKAAKLGATLSQKPEDMAIYKQLSENKPIIVLRKK